MGWWSDAMRTRSTRWTYIQIPRDPAEPAIEPETAYLNVFLRSAHVLDVRRGLRRFHGAVSSSFTLPSRSGVDAEFVGTIAPPTLRDADPATLDRFIQPNQRLLGPVPYLGGDVTAEVGLFSVASSDLAAPYLSLLEDLSRTATLSFIAVALPFARPLRQGIDLLTGGGDDTALEIGFATVWRPPQQGWIVALRSDSSGGGRDYRVDAADGRLLDAGGRPVTDHPYLVLEVIAESRRDDWFRIPELAAAYAELQLEFRRGRDDGLADALTVFRRTALTCNDLLFDDAQALTGKVTRQVLALQQSGPAVRGGGATIALPDLADLSPFGGDR